MRRHAEQWISAKQAESLVGSLVALCKRAHAGLVRTRARLFLKGREKSEDADLPAEFWWAGGEEALEQDWDTGDFSTWIDNSLHLQAFGVTFAARDVLEMLAPETRGQNALRLSVAGNPE